MVKRVLVVFDDSDFEKLKAKKVEMSEDFKRSVSWEEFVLVTCGVRF